MKKTIVAFCVIIVSFSCVRDTTVLEALVEMKSDIKDLKENLEQLKTKQALSDSILHKKIDDKMDSLALKSDTLVKDSIPSGDFGF